MTTGSTGNRSLGYAASILRSTVRLLLRTDMSRLFGQRHHEDAYLGLRVLVCISPTGKGLGWSLTSSCTSEGCFDFSDFACR